jgi:hypothetical protein
MHIKVVNGKSLAEIRSWNATDEQHVAQYVDGDNQLRENFVRDTHFRAPHLIVAANEYLIFKCDLRQDGDRKIEHVFDQMIRFLKEESDRQSSQCTTCPLNQRDVFEYCPTPSEDRVERKKKNKDLPLIIGAVAAGSVAVGGGIALLALLLGGAKNAR